MRARTSGSQRSLTIGLIMTSFAIVLGAAACYEPASAPSTPDGTLTAAMKQDVAGVGDQVARLRAATARFQDIDAARDAG